VGILYWPEFRTGLAGKEGVGSFYRGRQKWSPFL